MTPLSTDPPRVDLAEAARRHERELLAFAARLLGDVEAARDALQEAWVRALQAARDGAAPENERAWLYRLVYHAAIDRLRRRSIEHAGLGRIARSLTSPRPGLSGDEALEKLLSLLPVPQREVLLLRYVHGFTYAEIEDVLGRPAAILRVLAARALEGLHARWKETDR